MKKLLPALHKTPDITSEGKKKSDSAKKRNNVEEQPKVMSKDFIPHLTHLLSKFVCYDFFVVDYMDGFSMNEYMNLYDDYIIM